jgi:hypothetical protein
MWLNLEIVSLKYALPAVLFIGRKMLMRAKIEFAQLFLHKIAQSVTGKSGFLVSSVAPLDTLFKMAFTFN